jgi:hypothetical protein
MENKTWVAITVAIIGALALVIAGLVQGDVVNVSVGPLPTVTATVTATAGPASSTQPGQDTPTSVAGAVTYLADLQSLEHRLNSDPQDISGKTYSRALSNPLGGCSQIPPVEWNLSGDYAKFATTIGLSDDSIIRDAAVNFVVSLDGRLIADRTLEFGQAQEVALNVKQGLRLRLESKLVRGNVRNNCNSEAVAVWGDPMLTS